MAASGALLIGSLGLGAFALKKKQEQADSKNLINTVVGGDDQRGKTLDQWFVNKVEDTNGSVRDKRSGKTISAVAHPIPYIKTFAQIRQDKLESGPPRPGKIPTSVIPVAQSGMLTNNQ